MNYYETMTYVLGLFCAALMVMLLAETKDNNNLKRQAIENGYAKYSEKTGRWTWK